MKVYSTTKGEFRVTSVIVKARNRYSIVSFIFAFILACFPLHSNGQNCAFGKSTINQYQSYGFSSTDNGNVDDAYLATGHPDGNYAEIKKGNRPDRRGSLVVEMNDIVPQNDTIYFNVGSNGNASGQYVVATSSNGSSFTANATYSSPSSGFSKDWIVVSDPAGAKFIRFATIANDRHLYLEHVSYTKRTCYKNCGNLPINYTSGNAAEAKRTTIGDAAAINSEDATGAPDNVTALVSYTRGLLGITLDRDLKIRLDEVLPYGTIIQLYIARGDSEDTQFEVKTGTSFSGSDFDNEQNFLATEDWLVPYYYRVEDVDGAEYLMINTPQLGSSIYVDAVDFIYPNVFGKKIISGAVFNDLNTNGSQNFGEAGTAGYTVNLYSDENSNGLVDSADVLIQTTSTTSNGDYTFETDSKSADFVVQFDQSTLPLNATMTTLNEFAINLIDLNFSECADFGYNECGASCLPQAFEDKASTDINIDVAISVLDNDLGRIDSSTVTVSNVNNADYGTVSINSIGVITYNPHPNFVGVDSFDYIVCNGISATGCDTALVVVTVNCPTVNGQNTISGSIFLDNNTNNVFEPSEEWNLGNQMTINIHHDVNGDQTIDGLDVVVQSIQTDANGNYEFILPNNSDDFIVKIDPATGPTGSAVTGMQEYPLTFNGSNNAFCAIDFGVTFCSPNCVPEINDDIVTIASGSALFFRPLENDVDYDDNFDISSLTIVDEPSNGSVVIGDDGQVIYAPNGSFIGLDTFEYRICDGTFPNPFCGAAKVYVTVTEGYGDPCQEASKEHTFYFPYPENELRRALFNSSIWSTSNTASCSPSYQLGNVLRIITTIKSPYPGVVLTYDHWEDGYESDLNNPLQSSTLVWGDHDPSNGIAPGYPDDIIPPGGSIVLDNSVNYNPRLASDIVFDGRDKMHSTGDIAVSKIAGDLNNFAIQAAKTDVYDTQRFGESFTVPFGEGSGPEFQYTSLFVRASENNTEVRIDYDNDSDVDTVANINEGEVLFVDGGISAGALITSTKPVGVDVLFGGLDCFGTRQVNLLPAEFYANVYYSPVPTTRSNVPAAVYLNNSLPRDLTINYYSQLSSGPITIPANSYTKFVLSDDSGYKFVNPTGESFTAIEVIDSDSYGQDYDWAFNLISGPRLTNFASIAWAPGSINGSANYNPLWITPTGNTTVYIKYNGDITTPSALTSPCGLPYDEAIELDELEYHRIYDMSDNDQSGIAVYTCDGTTIAAAYGEDGSASGSGATPIASPAWDVGTSVQPMCLDRLILANDDCVNALPNDFVTIDVTVNDHAFLTTLDKSSVSTLGLKQPANGTLINNGDGTFQYTPFPSWEGIDTFQYSICSVEYPDLCDIASVFVKVDICDANPFENNVNGFVYFEQLPDDGLYTNEDRRAGIEVYLYSDVNCDSILDAEDLLIEKAVTDANGAYSFHTVNGQFAKDEFTDTVNINGGNNGSVAWANDWQETGEFDGFSNGNVRIDTDVAHNQNVLQIGGANNGANRDINFTSATNAILKFKYRRSNLTDNGGTLSVRINNVNVAIIGDGNGVGTDAYYINQTINIPFPNIQPNGSNEVEFVTNGSVGNTSYYLIDDVEIVYNTDEVCFITKIGDLQGEYLPAILSEAQASFDATLGNCVPNRYLGIVANIQAYDNYSENEIDVPQNIDILSNDYGRIDTSNVSMTGLLQPKNGNVVIQPDGNIIYYPNTGFEGLDTFQYSICNLEDANVCDTAYVFIKVSCELIANGNSIAGSIFSDRNANGVWDVSEDLFPGIDVFLYEDEDANGILSAVEASNPIDTVTAVNGNYKFILTPASATPTTISTDIVRPSDNAEEFVAGGSTNISTAIIDIVESSGFTQKVGLRFTQLNIPREANISNATIKFRAINNDSDVSNLRFYAQAIDNAPTFVASSNNVSNRTKTTSYVEWNNVEQWIGGGTYTSPDLSSIIQEVVDRPGWNPLNSIAIIIEGEGRRRAYGHNVNSVWSPEIEITFGEVTYPASYIVSTDLNSIPQGAQLTTDNIETSTFTFLSQSDCVNNFGIATNSTVAVNDINATLNNMEVTGSVMRNDFDLEGDEITFGSYLSQADGTTPIISGVSVSGTDIGGGNVAKAGNLYFDSNGEYKFVPDSAFNGEVNINYTMCDNGSISVCDTSKLTIIVNPFPNPSAVETNATVIHNDYKIGYDTIVKGNVLMNDHDVEQDRIKLQNIFYSANGDDAPHNTVGVNSSTLIGGINEYGEPEPFAGTLTMYANGDYEFEPFDNFKGVAKVKYTACDDYDAPYQSCKDAILTIDLLKGHGSNDAPFAGDDFITTIVNNTVNGNWIKNDRDSDGEQITIAGTTDLINPDNIYAKASIDSFRSLMGGNVVMFTDGTYDYTPPANYYGPDQLAYRICDVASTVACDSATIYFLVAPIFMDYGDLPAQFPIAANFLSMDFNGDAKPDLPKSIWLGNVVDHEIVSYQHNNASGDDDNGKNDEDGLIIPNNARLGSTAEFKVRVSSLEENTMVYFGLWFDWDFDGVFDDFYNGSGATSDLGQRMGERITVPVSIPSNVPTENVGIRLRAFQSMPNASQFGGEVRSGEVEDYILFLLVGNTLPVELIAFNAEAQQRNALLSWSTATEINNDYFSVQRSVDAINWTEVGIVEGAGTTEEQQNYEYMDENLSSGTYYYRLQQFDFDGTNEFTEVKSVVINEEAAETAKTISIFPNPVHKHGQISIKGLDNVNRYDVRIFGVDGNEKVYSYKGASTIVDLSKFELSAGTYIMQIHEGNNVYNEKFIVFE